MLAENNNRIQILCRAFISNDLELLEQVRLEQAQELATGRAARLPGEFADDAGGDPSLTQGLAQ